MGESEMQVYLILITNKWYFTIKAHNQSFILLNNKQRLTN